MGDAPDPRHTLPIPSPYPPHSTSVPGTEVLWGGYGEGQVGLWRWERSVGDATFAIPPNHQWETKAAFLDSGQVGNRGIVSLRLALRWYGC